MGQRLRFEEPRPSTPCRSPRPYHQDSRQPNHLSTSKSVRRLQRQRSSPRYSSIEERPSCRSSSRQITKSPDSGLDCGSEEEGSLGYRGSYHSYTGGSPLRVGSGPQHAGDPQRGTCGETCSGCRPGKGHWPSSAAWRRTSWMPFQRRGACGSRTTITTIIHIITIPNAGSGARAG